MQEPKQFPGACLHFRIWTEDLREVFALFSGGQAEAPSRRSSERSRSESGETLRLLSIQLPEILPRSQSSTDTTYTPKKSYVAAASYTSKLVDVSAVPQLHERECLELSLEVH